MKLLKRFLCWLGLHDYDIEIIIIQPMYTSEWLPEHASIKARNALMHTCNRCGDEEITA